MPCPHSTKKHTPIVSKKQRGFFGAEYRRGKLGKKKKTGMSQAILRRHLKESKGKKLAKMAKKSRKT